MILSASATDVSEETEMSCCSSGSTCFTRWNSSRRVRCFMRNRPAHQRSEHTPLWVWIRYCRSSRARMPCLPPWQLHERVGLDALSGVMEQVDFNPKTACFRTCRRGAGQSGYQCSCDYLGVVLFDTFQEPFREAKVRGPRAAKEACCGPGGQRRSGPTKKFGQ